jgi:predicted ATPase/class 3 adenylate cyclase/Tfp pilus assembly protein PilF
MGQRYALLLTDVADSTSLTEQLGDAVAARLWAAHDRLARDLLPPLRGREIDKTDGLLLLFADAADAASYAAAYHSALRTLDPPLSARAGLHVGEVILRENSAADIARGAKPVEVDGIAKATAARIMSIANAGQTLLSSAAKDALGDASVQIRSHGHWKLKGVSEPAELFATGDDPASWAAPAENAKAYRVTHDGELWIPIRQIRHSLPAERDAFIGRRDALDELARRFDGGARVVSLIGIGGTGKTRLATRFASAWLGEFPGGAWFCDLSQARGIEGIAYAVGQALDLTLGKDDPLLQLGHAISARGRCLIVLDNFEQVSRHAEATLGQWLSRAPEARFLVTSRAVLAVAGESVLSLSPLSTADAAALFVQRARAAKVDFQPRGDDEAAIVPLVALLEGLPLAIELAAARVRVMSPRMLLSRMDERFKLLSTGDGRLGRQSTLRATFDWSWDLLSIPERAALAQLSVFEGGFGLQAAEAVLDLSAFEDPPWPPDALQSLVDKSFVRRLSGDRFDLLASVQAYAAEHLCSAGRYPGSGPQAAQAAEARHGAHYASLDERQVTAQRSVELDNLVAACRRAQARGDARTAAQTLEGAWAGIRLRGPFSAGLDLVLLVQSMSALPVALQARVNAVAGRALQALGRVGEARSHYATALGQARQVGDRTREGRLLGSLGNLDANEARMDEARRHFTEALAIARETGNSALECELLSGFGTLDDYLGQLDDARRHYEAALALARRIGDRHWEGGILGNLGGLDMAQGRTADARAHFEASLVVARELGDRQWEGNALCNLGLLHQLQGELAQARDKLESALQVAREIGHPRLESIVLCNLGIVDDAMGNLDDARRRYEAALVVARELGDRRSEGQFLGYLGTLHARQGRFDAARRDLDAGAGLLRELHDLFSLGLLLCGRAEADWLAGAQALAGVALAEAQAIATEVGAGSGSELAVALDRVRSLSASPAPARSPPPP